MHTIEIQTYFINKKCSKLRMEINQSAFNFRHCHTEHAWASRWRQSFMLLLWQTSPFAFVNQDAMLSLTLLTRSSLSQGRSLSLLQGELTSYPFHFHLRHPKTRVSLLCPQPSQTSFLHFPPLRNGLQAQALTSIMICTRPTEAYISDFPLLLFHKSAAETWYHSGRVYSILVWNRIYK